MTADGWNMLSAKFMFDPLLVTVFGPTEQKNLHELGCYFRTIASIY
jgi:hypothetical protein